MGAQIKRAKVNVNSKAKHSRTIGVGAVKNVQQSHKLCAGDIKPGMRVRASQLVDILDTYIVLKDVKLVKNKIGVGTFEGTIASISKTPLRVTETKSVLVYNDSYEREEYCEYE